MKPQRIQLSRAKGFNLQRHSAETNGLPAVNVARPSRWGNPFPIGRAGPLGRVAADNEGAVGLFRDMLSDPEMRAAAGYPKDIKDLAGRNLACFCPLDHMCHADVLLEMANNGSQ